MNAVAVKMGWRDKLKSMARHAATGLVGIVGTFIATEGLGSLTQSREVIAAISVAALAAAARWISLWGADKPKP